MTEQFKTMHAQLVEQFLLSAQVINPDTMYIRMKGFNRVIPAGILVSLGRCWAASMEEDENGKFPLDFLVGLPSAGQLFVASLVIAMEERNPDLLVGETRKNTKPNSWLEEDVVKYVADSFTHGLKDVPAFINVEGVKKGSRVGLVDDALAHGHTALAATQAMRAAGFDVTHVFAIMDKEKQEGAQRLRDKGVTVSSLITVEGLNPDQSIRVRCPY